MARSTVHYADSETNNILKKLHNKLRPAGTPVQRVEYIIELLMLRIFEVKIQQDPEFAQLREMFRPDPKAVEEKDRERDKLLFSSLLALPNDSILPQLNQRTFPFYSRILGEARKVWKGNLSTKVQDQLVLIEEIFGNSNFTNNVTSGNMAEIIGLVADLDKDRLLKTDLLGDAIESALSETGKDVLLYQVPNHIRHFMVGLVAPTFDDQIFDPTAGPGGMLFDSFEYVMERVRLDGQWPGAKAHPELIAWFKNWCAQHAIAMPTIEETTDFYRSGITGYEYQGTIRKMAAINFYIRGLNPANVKQGDALQKFGDDILPESATAIVNGPPFGAERDQASYPNVWKEHAAESETTILFVKLMVETLRQHGRCAVIVSEGFLTWDQNSARALRRALLDECNLQAIISLPQGVFVSKGGSGPKTSILYFVKGRPTQSVWFYKVANDGYSLGAHRKAIAGCQLVEALDLFHRHVCAGKEPPETRESFSIPAEWIKALDPRVKDRIRAETRAEMDVKAEEDHASLAEKLAAQVAARKLTATERDDRLAQNAATWESKIANTIAQRIERAHQCAFNLPSYRSPLNDEERTIWNKALPSVVAEYDKDISRKFATLRRAEPGDIPSLLTAFDPKSALEVDLVHEVIATLSTKTVSKIPALKTIAALLARQAAHARTPLKRIVVPVSRRLKKSPTQTYKLITVKYYGRGVALRSELSGREVKGNNWFQVAAGDLIFSKIDARNGAFGIVPAELDGAIVSNEFPTFTVDAEQASPRFLVTVLSSQPFYSQVESIVAGATRRRRLEPEQFLEMSLPLPDLKTQQHIAAEIDLNQATMRRAADELERLRGEVNRVWET